MLSLLYRAADALRRRTYSDNHGRLGEDMAHRYLRRHGCTIVARNYRPLSGSGEIDIVAWHRDALVFIEVKTRATGDFGTPDRAVDAEKRQRIVRGAADYLRHAGGGWEKVRFDVVSVTLAPRTVEWLRDAFGKSLSAPGI